MPLPKVLSGLTLCPSGIDTFETLTALTTEATRLGATFTTELTRSVTHLICTKAGSAKHRQVIQWNIQSPSRQIPIVRPTWLAACSSAVARVPTAPHSMQPLEGFEICCSGISLEDKVKVAAICDELGSIYSKSLGISCSHLLCAEPVGKKYEFAVKTKQMFIIKPAWMFECEKLGTLADESMYLLAPVNGKVVKNGCKGGNIIGGAEKKKEVSKVAKIPTSSRIDTGKSARSTIDGTSSKTKRKANGSVGSVANSSNASSEIKAPKSAAQTTVKAALQSTSNASAEQKSSQGNTSKSDEDNKMSQSVAGSAPDEKGVVGEPCRPAWMDREPGLYLDAFTFYLTPCPLAHKSMHAPRRAKALKLLALGGGSLSDELTPRVNFIVIIRLPIVSSKVSEIENAQKMGATLVGLDWLEKCVTEKMVIEHDNSLLSEWMREDTGTQQTEGSQAQHHADFKSSLFQGLRCALGPLALYDSGAVAAVRQKLKRGRGKVLAHDGRGVVSSGVATHVVCGDSLAAGAKRLVDSAMEKNRHLVVVTVDWIDACLQAERLVRVDDCVLYTPAPHETPLRDMLRSKVSVTITGHQVGEKTLNARRDVLSRLARLLGAGYSERMTKGKTTHLIADGRSSMKSNKVGMAKRWGIEIVNYRWLLACAQTGVVVDAADFPVTEESESPKKDSEGIDDEGDEDEKGVPNSARTENVDTLKRARGDMDDTKRTLFESPTGPARRSPRIKRKTESDEVPATTAAETGDKLFERFTAGLLKSSAGMEVKVNSLPAPPPTRRRSTRSASVSLDLPDDDQKQWSLDASQSQVIVHRDLTPPPTPGRGVRNMPPRAAKRRRA